MPFNKNPNSDWITYFIMKKSSFAALAAFVFVISCSDETTVFQETLDKDVALESSQTKLESSINYDKAGVLDIFEDVAGTGKNSKFPEGEAGDYPLTLVAQVDPPSRSGAENLTAAHVHIVDDYAYVSYNTVEDGYSGAIDIVNVSDPSSPRVTSRLYYTNADLNSIKYDNGYLYVVGGVDSEKSVKATANSFVAKIVVSDGRMDLASGISYGFQDGFNATDVLVTTDRVLVTSGKEGFLTSYDKNTIEMQLEAPFADLRSVAISDNNKLAILDGSSGVKLLDQNFNVQSEISITSNFGNYAKRTLDFAGDHIIVAEGSKGAGIYDVSSGDLIEYIPILVNPEGVDESNIVTNAVAANDNIILMANGGAGLCISEDQGNNTDLVGIIELDASVNYVTSKGDYIFAAAGKDGLQIIKLNKPSESLEASCADVPSYSGSRNLNVNEGDNLAFRGSKRFNTVNVNGELLLCGSWTVSNNTNINNNAIFAMNGTYVVGRNNKRKDVTVNEGATFTVEGNLTIYGDLVLNEGATIEFLGDDSVVNIFGSVKKAATAEVKGNFRDVRNKF